MAPLREYIQYMWYILNVGLLSKYFWIVVLYILLK